MVKTFQNESIDNLLRRFHTEVERAGVIKEYRKREFFIKPSLIRHQKMSTIKRKRLLIKMRNGDENKNRYKYILRKKSKNFRSKSNIK